MRSCEPSTSSGVDEGLPEIVFEDECFLQVHVFQYLDDESVWRDYGTFKRPILARESARLQAGFEVL